MWSGLTTSLKMSQEQSGKENGLVITKEITTQKTQFLHQIVFEFPTLVRMNDSRHPESTDNQLEKRNGYG